MGGTIELARTTLQPAPADTAVLRISVRPTPGAVAASAVLLVTLITGSGPDARHVLGRFSLYPADQPGIFLLRLDTVVRQALRERSVPPQLVLSAEVPMAPASVTAPASAASAWLVTAQWLPEPRSR